MVIHPEHQGAVRRVKGDLRGIAHFGKAWPAIAEPVRQVTGDSRGKHEAHSRLQQKTYTVGGVVDKLGPDNAGAKTEIGEQPALGVVLVHHEGGLDHAQEAQRILDAPGAGDPPPDEVVAVPCGKAALVGVEVVELEINGHGEKFGPGRKVESSRPENRNRPGRRTGIPWQSACSRH